MIVSDPNMPSFDKGKNWDGIRHKVQKRFYKQVSTVALMLIIIVSSTIYFNMFSQSKLYSGTKFEKIVAMETALESELESLQDEIIEVVENPRYFSLLEQVNRINTRLEECKDHMMQNPLNPNFHRVYLSLLKTKRKALVQLNEMKG